VVYIKKAETTIQIKKDYRHHIPRAIFNAIGAKEGDYIKVIIIKEGKNMK
jgi:hypothetical protein